MAPLQLQPVESSTARDFILIAGHNGLQLAEAQSGHQKTIYLDFSTAPVFRTPQRRFLLHRAVGSHRCPQLIDATAGFGSDSIALAANGCRVIAIERNPVVMAMLTDARTRAIAAGGHSAEAAARLSLQSGEALQFIAGQMPRSGTDVIYLDPMFSPAQQISLESQIHACAGQIDGLPVR